MLPIIPVVLVATSYHFAAASLIKLGHHLAARQGFNDWEFETASALDQPELPVALASRLEYRNLLDCDDDGSQDLSQYPVLVHTRFNTTYWGKRQRGVARALAADSH